MSESHYAWAYEMPLSVKGVPECYRRDILRVCKKNGISVRQIKLVRSRGVLILPDVLNPDRNLGEYNRLYVMGRDKK